MAQGRYTTVFYVAVLVATVAAYGVYHVLKENRARSRIVTRPVVVALQDMTEGTNLDRVRVGVSQWPVQTVPAGAFGSVDSVLGRVTRMAVFTGEPIVPGRLAPPGTGPGLEVKIAPGKRAMAVRINDVAGISGLILPNSRVDVLVVYRDAPGAEKEIAKLFMENMRVLSVGTELQRGSDGRPIRASTVTLEVTPQEAEQLAIAVSQGKIQLVLRGYGDPDSVRTPGANSSEVLAQLRAGRTVQPVSKPVSRSRPVRRAADPPPPPVARVVEQPAVPDSLRVKVYRGTKVTEQKFEKDSSARSDTSKSDSSGAP